ncbi:MAG: hypothetical protein NT001_02640 [Candidatus Woesearchaeota archaeon]|nr:hypothetical protein [Candidatus Woesearchaeota archaeon]
MAKKNGSVKGVSRKVGHYSFLIGVIIALMLGIFSEELPVAWGPMLMFAMVVLGIIVGLLHIPHKEMNEFLLAAIALMLLPPSMSGVSVLLDSFVQGSGFFITSMLSYLTLFVVPAVLIVAVKIIVELAEEK